MIELRDVRARIKLVGAFLLAGVILLITIFFLTTGKVKESHTVSAPDLSNHPIYSSYDFGQDDNIIDFGIQPLGVPIGVLSEAMKRDIVLRKALSDQGLKLRFHPFLKGADVNFFLRRGDLEVALGGDMPALTACAASGVLIVTLTKQGFTSIVAHRSMLIRELRGKRIGYPFGSNAHYALLQVLSSAGLGETDVHLIRLNVNEMPDALAKGELDAFAAWEPIISIALTTYDDFVAIHRSLSTSYLYFSRSFAERYPEVVRQIAASQVRSMAWMRHQKTNLFDTCRQSMQAGEELSGQVPVLSEKQCASIVKSDLLDASLVGIIPERDLAPEGRLFREFQFLQGLGKIPDTVAWDQVRSCFDLALLEQVLSEAQKYRLDVYEYEHSDN